MRRERGIAGEACAVQACARAKILRVVGRRLKRIPAAEAVSDGALGARPHRLGAQEIQDRAEVGHRHIVVEQAHLCTDPLLDVCRYALERQHASGLIVQRERHLALAIVEIRDDAVVADGRDPAGDIEQLLAQAPDVHQDHGGGKRAAALRMGDEGVHPPRRGFELDKRFNHRCSRTCLKGEGRAAQVHAQTAFAFDTCQLL